MVEIYFMPDWWRARDADPLEWLCDNIPRTEYNFGKGWSWINGVQYPASIIFKAEQDAIVFKLKFPEIIKYLQTI